MFKCSIPLAIYFNLSLRFFTTHFTTLGLCPLDTIKPPIHIGNNFI